MRGLQVGLSPSVVPAGAPAVIGGNVLLFAPAAARAAARRAAAGTPARPMLSAAAKAKPCNCGHCKQAHQHYRRGSDCAMCSCAKYSRPFLSRFLPR